MKLFLIRHAQSLNNARPQRERIPDPPLTRIGHRQCELLAERVGSLRLTRLVCSPFLRTLQTADHIWRAGRVDVEVRTELHEQGGCISGFDRQTYVGQPGMTRHEIRTQFPSFGIAADIDGDGWWGRKPFEDHQQARRRAARLLEQTSQEFGDPSQRIAYVMHGELLQLLLDELGTAADSAPRNAGITEISLEEGGHQLAGYNCVNHLPSELVTY